MALRGRRGERRIKKFQKNEVKESRAEEMGRALSVSDLDAGAPHLSVPSPYHAMFLVLALWHTASYGRCIPCSPPPPAPADCCVGMEDAR